jgi:hypothetical protein
MTSLILTYENPNVRIFYSVKKGNKMLLRCFLAYQSYLESEIGDVDYKVVTQSNFDIASAQHAGPLFTNLIRHHHYSNGFI